MAQLNIASTPNFPPSSSEVVQKYPDIPPLVILKTDVQRRGVLYTDAALTALDAKLQATTGTHIFGSRDGKIAPRPESLLLRDGSSIITTPTPLDQDPYLAISTMASCTCSRTVSRWRRSTTGRGRISTRRRRPPARR